MKGLGQHVLTSEYCVAPVTEGYTLSLKVSYCNSMVPGLLDGGNIVIVEAQVHSIDLDAGESISHWIFPAEDALDGASRFDDGGEVTLLPK